MPEIVAQPDPANVPPYKGRTTGPSDDLSGDLTGTVERQLADTKTGRPGAAARGSTGIDPQEPSGATLPASGSST